MKRIEWIDSIRGLGIVLVILGHMSIPEILRQFIFSFHMPLFFIVSGWLYNNNFSFKWCMRKLDSLFVPYLFYGVLTLGVLAFEGRYQMPELLQNYLLGNGVGVLWFLTCLLMVEFLGGIILKRVGASLFQAAGVIAVCSGLGCVFPRVILHNVLMIRTVPSALAFWLIGYVAKRIVPTSHLSWLQMTTSIVAMVCGGLLFFLQRVDMATASYGNVALFYITAISLSGLVFLAFGRLDVRPRILVFLGRCTLPLMCLHGVLPKLLRMVYNGDVMRFVNLAMLVTIAAFIHRWVPVLDGKARLFSRIAK